jgi:hypothetical protein
MMKERHLLPLVSKIAASLILLFCFSAIRAQDRETVDQTITWTSINSNFRFANKWMIVADAQFRFIHEFENMQHMVRAGVSYDITPNLSVVPLGYSFIYNYKYGKQPAGFVNHEQRLWQQIFYKHKIKNIPMNHRLRLEERWLQERNATNESNDYSDYQWRMRYRILANIPLTAKSLDPKTFYLSVWDEFFVSWGETVTFNKINQNRIFIGPGYQVTKNTQIQAGYYYQMLIKANGAKQENNIGFLIQLNANADLRGKKE